MKIIANNMRGKLNIIGLNFEIIELIPVKEFWAISKPYLSNPGKRNAISTKTLSKFW